MVDQNLLLIAYIVPIAFGLVLMTKAGDGPVLTSPGTVAQARSPTPHAGHEPRGVGWFRCLGSHLVDFQQNQRRW